jgi:hypothetical protein
MRPCWSGCLSGGRLRLAVVESRLRYSRARATATREPREPIRASGRRCYQLKLMQAGWRVADNKHYTCWLQAAPKP